MSLLLDTHAFLWFILNDARLSGTAKTLLSSPANVLFLSPASYWEMAIKIGTGKYVLSEPYGAFMHREITTHGIRILDITLEHCAVLTTLPRHHRDPFDRLLIAQAMVEGISIVSTDADFDAYPITRLW